MAQVIATFDLMSFGSGTVNSEIWVDLTAQGPNANSPIPNGQQIWLGFLTCISDDKNLTFEIRPNLPTKSLGNLTDTQLRASVAVSAGDSKDLDLHFNGDVQTLAPVGAASTGVEKLWLRIKAGSSSAGTFTYILYYSLY